MCGIFGYIGTQAVTEILIAGLEKLEYRGYDSAGIATVWEGKLHCVQTKGKLQNLRSESEKEFNLARIGIGHTRWASHGKPEEQNAHPHQDMASQVAVVQNGVIENYRELQEELKSRGHEFVSDTDTEVIPHLIAEILATSQTQSFSVSPSLFLEAVRKAVQQLQGAYALAVICTDYPDELVVAREQAPLILGIGQAEFYCASDTSALVSHTRAVLSLENEELAVLTPLGIEVYNKAGDRLNKFPRILD